MEHTELKETIRTLVLEAQEMVVIKRFDSMFKSDWVQRGMEAWFTGAELSEDGCIIEVYFYFGDHEENNLKYFHSAPALNYSAYRTFSISKDDDTPFETVEEFVELLSASIREKESLTYEEAV